MGKSISWIGAVVASAFCWASADITFDVILDSKESDLPQKKQLLPQTTTHLTHSQTMLLCALTTYIIIFVYFIYIESIGPLYSELVGKYSLFASVQSLPFLIVSGTFSYYHYHFIIKAFENSSSTVILPFLQFSSIFAFLFLILQNYISNRPFLSSYLHLLAYFLILLGGLAPATDGHLIRIFQIKFWSQPFVKFAIISDMSHALYTNIISYVGRGDNDSQQFNIYVNMEFFILTRVMFVIIQTVKLYSNPEMQIEFIQLFNKPIPLILGTMIGEFMTLFGYFSSVYAYQTYYQAAVISASESSLNLIMNLFLAYFVKKHLNIGKQASLYHLQLKVVSCLAISIGLAIATI
ncbi:unnamed protein product (macronuclear) [Paramecium tetraurelia]|uniref:EamA domain-containing protein n=1 Tax=Paramecium tetraurelia TaxID=5888 RepID=A0C6H8_PARTE|nr:uncharacterized protein GSPATT00035524001 [Paramecium tetraurelia]CAK66395.1 unnamed protein product [Paramecium tetraurelia]|eukprot:XP_001433792.1 hypothetical protein (macronuclear) [Paramecium tetraurelia strain d4-2]